ncbi:MAG: DUF1223 domain-containing protein [Parvularculaceae bacterium]
MRSLRIRAGIVLAVLALSGAAGGVVRAADGDPTPAVSGSTPVAVEIFLSQACGRCPPAADYLTDLAARPDVVALAWHVDYWNFMARGADGHWDDPFSDDAFSERQRIYNLNIRKRSSVFTPQAVIAGVETAVGSNRDAVESLIDAAQDRPAMTMRMGRKDDTITIAVDGADEPCEAFLVTFQREARTTITGGDNAGVLFVEANVVTDVQRLGAICAEAATFSAPAPGEGKGCALLVQEPEQGRIISAAYCPAET